MRVARPPPCILRSARLEPLRRHRCYSASRESSNMLAWHQLHRAAKLAQWSGMCYLPWKDLPDVAAAENLRMVASGRTHFTAWFVADGMIDYGDMIKYAQRFKMSTPAADLEAMLAPPPPRLERFVFLRGVHWSAPDSDSVKVSRSLMDFWPLPFADLPFAASTSAHIPPLVAHRGVASLASTLFPDILPHIAPPLQAPSKQSSAAHAPTSATPPVTPVASQPIPPSTNSSSSSRTTSAAAPHQQTHQADYSSSGVQQSQPPLQSQSAPSSYAANSAHGAPEGGTMGTIGASSSPQGLHGGASRSLPLASAPSPPSIAGLQGGEGEGVGESPADEVPTHLTFAGHSLGGALGKLLCLLTRLEVPQWSPDRLECLTFGSPPVLAHRDGGGGAKALRTVGMRPDQVQNFVLENDPIPRALLTADPLLNMVKDFSGVQALMQMRGWLLGEGAAFSPNRYLFENLGQVHLIEWSQEGGTEVQQLDPADLQQRLMMSVEALEKMPLQSLQAVLDHHHGSYAQELELAGLMAARRALR